MKLKRIFRDVARGDIVTSTVHAFGLNGPQLVKQGVLKISERAVVCQPPGERRPVTTNVLLDYVFKTLEPAL